MRRFEYLAMTAGELSDALRESAMSPKTFCRLFGTNTRTMERWLCDEQPVPIWVPIVMQLLRTAGGAHGALRRAAADHIIRDTMHPERGEFPYRTTEYPDND